jgi:hypothetical protein
MELATGDTLKIRAKVRAIPSDQDLSRQAEPYFLSPRWHPCTVFCGRCVLSSQIPFRISFPIGDAQDGGYKIYIANLHGYYGTTVMYFHHRPAVDPGGMCEAARLVMVILMIGTVSAAYGADRPHFGSQMGMTSDGTFGELHQTIVQVTMTCIFCCMMQYTVPIIGGWVSQPNWSIQSLGHAWL